MNLISIYIHSILAMTTKLTKQLKESWFSFLTYFPLREAPALKGPVPRAPPPQLVFCGLEAIG